MIKALVLKLKIFIFNTNYGLHHTTLNNYSETLFEVPENSGLIKKHWYYMLYPYNPLVLL